MSECLDHGQKGRTYGKGLQSKGFRGSHLHRQVFFETHGFLPVVVRHTCDNMRCINPDHLIGGTQSDNMKDRSLRGRSPRTQPTKRKLTFEAAESIRASYTLGLTMKALSEAYGVSTSNIYNIIRGTTYVSA